MIWLDGLALALVVSLGLTLVVGGFGYLLRQDVAEGQHNREDACGDHRWTRMAEGLRCAACGKVPQG